MLFDSNLKRVTLVCLISLGVAVGCVASRVVLAELWVECAVRLMTCAP